MSARMICTVDEEGDMTGSDHIVEQEFVKKEDYVLDLEPTDGEIQMAHKGRTMVSRSCKRNYRSCQQARKRSGCNICSIKVYRTNTRNI